MLPTDTGALTVNAYIPLVGVASSCGGLTVGVVGFPWFAGDFKFEEVRNARRFHYDSGSAKFDGPWFLEIFGDYGCPMPMAIPSMFEGTFSLFGKVNFMRIVNADFTFTRRPTNVSDVYDFSFYRTMFVVGGKATLNFSTPNGWGWL